MRLPSGPRIVLDMNETNAEPRNDGDVSTDRCAKNSSNAPSQDFQCMRAGPEVNV